MKPALNDLPLHVVILDHPAPLARVKDPADAITLCDDCLATSRTP